MFSNLIILIKPINYFKTILLEASWAELFILSAFQWSLSTNFDRSKCPLFIENFDSINNKKEEIFCAIQNIYERFKTYTIDQGELICLKAIVLFRPGKTFFLVFIINYFIEINNLQNISYIEGLQDQAQLMLQQHVARRFPSSTRYINYTMFSKVFKKKKFFNV